MSSRGTIDKEPHIENIMFQVIMAILVPAMA